MTATMIDLTAIARLLDRLDPPCAPGCCVPGCVHDDASQPHEEARPPIRLAA